MSGTVVNLGVTGTDGRFTTQSPLNQTPKSAVRLQVTSAEPYHGGWYQGPGLPLSDSEADAFAFTGDVDLGVIELVPFPYLEGTVTDSTGAPVPDVDVVATARPGAAGAWTDAGSGLSDSAGHFVIAELAAGTDYRLWFDPWNQFTNRAMGGYLTAPGGTVADDATRAGTVRAPSTGIDSTLPDGVSISGRLSVVNTTYSAGSWSVQAYEAGSGHAASAARLDRNGGFRVDRLWPGRPYALCFSGGDDSGCYAGQSSMLTTQPKARVVTAPSDGVNAMFVPNGWKPPHIVGTPRVGTRMTATFDLCSLVMTCTFAWERDGAPLPGAAGASYTPTAGDFGKHLAVHLVGTQGTTTPFDVTIAAPGTVAVGAAPTLRTKPSIKGTAKVGGTVKVSAGTWSTPGLAVTYQWYRGSTPIRKATSATYHPVAADAGKKIVAHVHVSKARYTSASATASATVAKVTSNVRASLVHRTVNHGHHAVVTVTVATRGFTPTGTVTVTCGSAHRSVTLHAAAKGKAKITLPRLRPGRYHVTVTFHPTKSLAHSATSASRGIGTLKVT